MVGSCGLLHAERGEDNTDGAMVRGVENTLPDEAEGLEKSKERVENVGLGGACGVPSRQRRDMELDTPVDRKG